MYASVAFSLKRSKRLNETGIINCPSAQLGKSQFHPLGKIVHDSAKPHHRLVARLNKSLGEEAGMAFPSQGAMTIHQTDTIKADQLATTQKHYGTGIALAALAGAVYRFGLGRME
jgi:hypothetical protein